METVVMHSVRVSKMKASTGWLTSSSQESCAFN